ncbi:hypothetical protein AOLI_G00212730 [Acnodon oligacanthus]
MQISADLFSRTRTDDRPTVSDSSPQLQQHRPHRPPSTFKNVTAVKLRSLNKTVHFLQVSSSSPLTAGRRSGQLTQVLRITALVDVVVGRSVRAVHSPCSSPLVWSDAHGDSLASQRDGRPLSSVIMLQPGGFLLPGKPPNLYRTKTHP